MHSRTKFPHPIRIALPLLAAVLLAGPGPSRSRGAAAAGVADSMGSGSIEVRLLAIGEPVAGFGVQVRPAGAPGTPNTDEWIDDPNAHVAKSDVGGIARFSGLSPGRYLVIGDCGGIKGDYIGGSIATRV
jgi:hypothetical protein